MNDQFTSCPPVFSKIYKSHVILDLCGNIDELNAWIGKIKKQNQNNIKIYDELNRIQYQLLNCKKNVKRQKANLNKKHIAELKLLTKNMKAYNNQKEIMPDSDIAIAKAVCHRTERIAVKFLGKYHDKIVIEYLNNLAKYLNEIDKLLKKEQILPNM